MDAARAHLDRCGVRRVLDIDLEDIRRSHAHPADLGAAIVSFDQATPPGSWRWAGPSWAGQVRTGVATGLAGLRLAAEDPDRAGRALGRRPGDPAPGGHAAAARRRLCRGRRGGAGGADRAGGDRPVGRPRRRRPHVRGRGRRLPPPVPGAVMRRLMLAGPGEGAPGKTSTRRRSTATRRRSSGRWRWRRATWTWACSAAAYPAPGAPYPLGHEGVAEVVRGGRRGADRRPGRPCGRAVPDLLWALRPVPRRADRQLCRPPAAVDLRAGGHGRPPSGVGCWRTWRPSPTPTPCWSRCRPAWTRWPSPARATTSPTAGVPSARSWRPHRGPTSW